METGNFETWLGSVIQPGESFCLAGRDAAQVSEMIARAAAIGYEGQIAAVFELQHADIVSDPLDLHNFTGHEVAYTIIDVRNTQEVRGNKIFKDSINIPLPEIRNRINEIPADKPVMVHCASGYRSAAGSAFIESVLGNKVQVFDLGEAVKNFQ